MPHSVKKLCLYAMGIALFVSLTLCLQVPVFENYYLCLGYMVMAVYCYSFGPLAGAVTGTLGVVLYCVLTNGLRGMPGWALGNLVIGLAVGFTFRRTRKLKSSVLRWLINAASVAAATAVGILIIKSGVEHILYGQPFWFRAAKNLYAFAADIALLLGSLPICARLDRFLMDGKKHE